MASLDLRDAWRDLVRRRPALAPSLGFQDEIFARWASTSVHVEPLGLSSTACGQRWARGVPLGADSPPRLEVDEVEELLVPALRLVAGIRTDATDAIQHFAQAWDRGEVTPQSLLPDRGRLGVLPEAIGLAPEVVAFVSTAALRPLLEAYFAPCRQWATIAWTLGICPFCGGPPGWGDIVEDGRRRLSCHLCGSDWLFARVQCPYCGTADSKELVRLEPGAGEEGYSISACTRCRAYLKELDRRVRWNGGPALVEDWGSPHFDMAARRSGYWRPVPSLMELSMP